VKTKQKINIKGSIDTTISLRSFWKPGGWFCPAAFYHGLWCVSCGGDVFRVGGIDGAHACRY